MARMLDRLRQTPPREIGGLAVTGFEDLRDEDGRLGPLKGATDAAARNVLIFRWASGAAWSLRPSGTEPKAKIYLEVCSPPCAPGTHNAAWRKTCREVDELANGSPTISCGRPGVDRPRSIGGGSEITTAGPAQAYVPRGPLHYHSTVKSRRYASSSPRLFRKRFTFRLHGRLQLLQLRLLFVKLLQVALVQGGVAGRRSMFARSRSWSVTTGLICSFNCADLRVPGP